jgi:hypothetical protein
MKDWIGEVVSKIVQLQDQILDRWGATEAELGPLFYKLRAMMKKQGSRRGLGFTAWLKKNGIPRSTAIRWADDYAERIGKKQKRAQTKPTVDIEIDEGAGGTAKDTTEGANRGDTDDSQAGEKDEDDFVLDETKSGSDQPEADQSAPAKKQTVNYVRLMYSSKQYQEFVDLELALRPHLGTGNRHSTVLAALKMLHSKLSPPKFIPLAARLADGTEKPSNAQFPGNDAEAAQCA